MVCVVEDYSNRDTVTILKNPKNILGSTFLLLFDEVNYHFNLDQISTKST